MGDKVYGYIYKITNKINGKVYIGQTKSRFNKRYTGGRWWECTTNQHLKFSAIKYGVENFEVDKNFYVAFSKEQLDQAEKYWIKHYKSNIGKYGYNKKDGGSDGSPNKETLIKITKANKKNALKRKGISRNKTTRRRIKETKLNNFLNECDEKVAKDVEFLVSKNLFKKDICEKLNLSMWKLNKIIEYYNIEYVEKGSMSGKKGTKHHNYNVPMSEECRKKISETWDKKIHDKYVSEIEDIKNMLGCGVSKSEIARRYNISRAAVRKIIKVFKL